MRMRAGKILARVASWLATVQEKLSIIPRARSPERKRKKKRWFNWVAAQASFQALMTLVTVGVLIYHGRVFTKQQKALKEQSILLAQSVELTKTLVSQEAERAYIGVKRIEIIKLEPNQFPEIAVVFFNGGRTPGNKLVFFRQIYTVPDPEPNEPSHHIRQRT